MSDRFQIVGSLLRPQNLLEYKRKIEQREDITYPFYADFEGYEEVETAAIKTIVDEQIAHNITIVTDGEFSKSLWHLDFVWGLGGIQRYIADHGYSFEDDHGEYDFETRKDIGLRITDTLTGVDHHFIKIFKELQEFAGDHQTKLCIPSPAHIFGELSWSDNLTQPNAVYKTTDELKAGLAKAYKEFLKEYAKAGGKIIQLDDCLWTIFADDNARNSIGGTGAAGDDPKKLAADFVDINNEVTDYGHSLGLKVWTHNCRGNYDSRNAGGGSYARIAELILKPLHYDRYFLEWDDDRAGSLEALKVFQDKPNVEIVLGLLSSKTKELDDEERVIKLLDEASKIIDKDRLYLSHQCGFASCDCGNALTEAEEWAKIEQGQAIAKRYWGV